MCDRQRVESMARPLSARQKARIWVTAMLAGRVRDGDGNPFSYYVSCMVHDEHGDVVWCGWVACDTQEQAIAMLHKYPNCPHKCLMERVPLGSQYTGGALERLGC